MHTGYFSRCYAMQIDFQFTSRIIIALPFAIFFPLFDIVHFFFVFVARCRFCHQVLWSPCTCICGTIINMLYTFLTLYRIVFLMGFCVIIDFDPGNVYINN